MQNVPFPTSRAYLRSCIVQAVPLQIASTTLGVICAEEVPLRTTKDTSAFWDAKRTSSEFVSNIIQSIAEMEPGTTGKGVGQLVRRLKDSIGVNQLYNWPGSNAAQRELSAVSNGLPLLTHL